MRSFQENAIEIVVRKMAAIFTRPQCVNKPGFGKVVACWLTNDKLSPKTVFTSDF